MKYYNLRDKISLIEYFVLYNDFALKLFTAFIQTATRIHLLDSTTTYLLNDRTVSKQSRYRMNHSIRYKYKKRFLLILISTKILLALVLSKTKITRKMTHTYIDR